MKKAIFLMSGLFCSAFICAADEQRLTFGNITIGKVYNQAHHRVLLTSPENSRTLVPSGGQRELAALFCVTQRVDAKKLTVEKLEEAYWLIAKGDHLFFFTHTPDGFKVHRVRDNGMPTAGRVLRPSDTEDGAYDLLMEHSKSNSKTAAFSLHPAGELEKKYSHAAARRSGSLARLSMRKSSASASDK